MSTAQINWRKVRYWLWTSIKVVFQLIGSAALAVSTFAEARIPKDAATPPNPAPAPPASP